MQHEGLSRLDRYGGLQTHTLSVAPTDHRRSGKPHTELQSEMARYLGAALPEAYGLLELRDHLWRPN